MPEHLVRIARIVTSARSFNLGVVGIGPLEVGPVVAMIDVHLTTCAEMLLEDARIEEMITQELVTDRTWGGIFPA